MNTKNIFVVGVCALFLVACASAFMKGGALVSSGYKPTKVLVAYQTQGPAPAGIEYQLIETPDGPAMFERSPDGSGALFLTRWRDVDGDHFAGWVATSHGFEFVVPVDRTKNAKRYVYPKGTYRLVEVDGKTRPVPKTKVEPITQLVPK